MRDARAPSWLQDTLDTVGFHWIAPQSRMPGPEGAKELSRGQARSPRLGCCVLRSPEGAKDLSLCFLSPLQGLFTTVPFRGLRAPGPPSLRACPRLESSAPPGPGIVFRDRNYLALGENPRLYAVEVFLLTPGS